MKKILLLLSFLLSSSAFADDGSGYVIGADIGFAHIHYQPDSFGHYISQTSLANVDHDKGIAGDFYIGYRLYRQLGWELGYMQFRSATFNYSDDTTAKAKRHDYDFLIRGDYPFSDTVSAYIKAGAALVNSRVEPQATDGTNVSAWTPIYGLGVSYHATNNTEINTQWLHINQFKSAAHVAGYNAAPAVPTVNYFSVGVAYRF